MPRLNNWLGYNGPFFDIVHNPSYDLDAALDVGLEHFPIEFVSFWGLEDEVAPHYLDPDDWEEYKRLYHLSARLASAAQGLVRPRRLPEVALSTPAELERESRAESEELERVFEAVRRLFPNHTENEFQDIRRRAEEPGTDSARTKESFLLTCMQLEAAKTYLMRPGELAERMLSLLDYLIKSKGERTRAYLRRVAECYVRDMPTEFAVMTRAVLQAALEDVLPEEKAREVLHLGKHEHVGLARLMTVAMQVGILEAEKSEPAARRIKVAGDQAAHDFPGLAPDADSLLGDLVTVLGRLERLKPQS